MVAVELPPELGLHLVLRKLILGGHLPYLLPEHGVQLLLGDAEQCVVACREADVVGLFEAAEHTYLRELSHSCEQHELKMLVGSLEH